MGRILRKAELAANIPQNAHVYVCFFHAIPIDKNYVWNNPGCLCSDKGTEMSGILIIPL